MEPSANKTSDWIRDAVRGRLLRRGDLTPRLIEVLELVSDGLTKYQIADRLVLSVRTVEDDMGELKAILDLEDRAQLPAFWLEQVYQVIDAFRFSFGASQSD